MINPFAGLPEPTAAAVTLARTAIDMTQEQAALLAGLRGRNSWWLIESGRRNIDPARWALFLLATDQHPGCRLSDNFGHINQFVR